MHPCRGFSCFCIYSFPQQKLPFLAEFSVKEGRPPRGKTACSTGISAFAISAWILHFFFFSYHIFFWTIFSLSYHTALMLTFSPGVKSSVTNSQLQLLFSSGISSPGRLASGLGKSRNKRQRVTIPPRQARKGKLGCKQQPWRKHRELFAEHPSESIPSHAKVTSSNAGPIHL